MTTTIRCFLSLGLAFTLLYSPSAEASWLSKSINWGKKKIEKEVRKVGKKLEKLEDKLEKVGKEIAKDATIAVAKDAAYKALMAAGFGPYPFLVEVTVDIAGRLVRDAWRCKEDLKCMRNSAAKSVKKSAKKAAKKALTQFAPEVFQAYELGKAFDRAI